MKKFLIATGLLLLTFIPTFFIIFNVVHATGLPNLATQSYVTVIFPRTESDPNHKTVTYKRESHEYGLIADILTDMTAIPAFPDDVNRSSFYGITFVSENGNGVSCRVYAPASSLAFYLETASGKYYRLPMPRCTRNGNEVSPAFVRYTSEFDDDSTLSSPDYTASSVLHIGTVSELSSLNFDKAASRLTVALYTDDSEAEPVRKSTLAEAASSGVSATRAVITGEWEYDHVTVRIGYVVRIGD